MGITNAPRAAELDAAGRVFVDPSAYADDERLHTACALLRRHSPVHWVDEPGFNPFFAVTRYQDIKDIEARNQLFTSLPRPILVTAEEDSQNAARQPLRTIVHMDDPDHRVFRNITAEWFLPRRVNQLTRQITALAEAAVDRVLQWDTPFDLISELAIPYPLHAILEILGLPAHDEPRMMQLTQELFGSNDPDLRRNGQVAQAFMEVLGEFQQYFDDLTEQRRRAPTDDLATVIATATVNGQPITPLEQFSYYVIVATAGHDTTTASIGGGLRAFIDYPDQWAMLQQDRSLIPGAVEEMIRWTTPVKQFMRTAQADTDISGVTVRRGEAVLLSYPSANRDESIFDHPTRFDITRQPNKHLSFGFGVHHCLGAMLARLELRVLLETLLERVQSFQLAGVPHRTHTTFVGGHKSLPVTVTRV